MYANKLETNGVPGFVHVSNNIAEMISAEFVLKKHDSAMSSKTYLVRGRNDSDLAIEMMQESVNRNERQRDEQCKEIERQLAETREENKSLRAGVTALESRVGVLIHLGEDTRHGGGVCRHQGEAHATGLGPKLARTRRGPPRRPV